LRRTRVWLCLIGALVWTFFFQASRARGDRWHFEYIWIIHFFCCETSSGFRCAPTISSFLFVLKQFALAALLLTSLITLGCHHTHTSLSLSRYMYIYICTCMHMHPFVYIVFLGFPWCMWANLYGMN
jgi:hypothetical protein